MPVRPGEGYVTRVTKDVGARGHTLVRRIVGGPLNSNVFRLDHDAGAGKDLGPGEPSCDFERTMPPSAFEGLLVSGAASVFVLSADPDFVAMIDRVSGAHQAIITIDAWPALIEAVVERRCGVAVLDVTAIGGALEQRIDELARLPAPPVIITAATLSDAPASMKALTERKIHRLLLKPASPGNTRLSLEAGIHRWRQLHEEQALPPPRSVDPRPAPATLAGPVRGRRGLWVGAGMALVFAVVVAGGLLGRSSPEPALEPSARPLPAVRQDPPVVAQDDPDAAATFDPDAEEVAYVDSALEVGLLADPPHDNALDGYTAILSRDPDHASARAGLAATVNLLFAEAENALLDGSFDAAAATLERVREVRPASTRLAFLDAQLEKARALAAGPAVIQPADPRPAAGGELDQLLQLSLERMQRGNLVAPAGDNALASYVRAAALDPEAPGVRALEASLRAALLATAQTLLASREIERIESLIDGLRRVGTPTAILADLDRQLSLVGVELQREREAGLLALGLERLSAGRVATPADDSAAFYLSSLMSQNPSHPELPEFRLRLSEALAERFRESVAQADWDASRELLATLEQIQTDPVFVSALAQGLEVAVAQAGFLATPVSAAELTLVAAHSPIYPSAALRSNIEGWVDLEFVVDRQGGTRDIVITRADPAGRFDRAATEALARYRFEPFAQDGVIYERRARMRMRFTLRD
jgi:periplasmic protein TonB